MRDLLLRRRGVSGVLLVLALTAGLSTVWQSPALGRKPKRYTDIKLPPNEWKIPPYVEFSLDNGISGFLVEDREVPMVDCYIDFTAPPDPQGKVGLAEMSTWVLRNGGSVNIPADSLNDLIEFEAAYLWISAGQENISIGTSCLVEDLPLMFSLMSDLIRNPAYPDDKIELKRSTMLEQVRRRNDRPMGIAFRHFSRILYPDHPWGWDTSEETVTAIQRDDLLEYHHTVFQPKGAVMGFSGAVDLKEVKRLAAENFGWLEPGSGEIAALPSEVGRPVPGVYYAYKKDVSQAVVVAGHQTIDYNNPQRHAATIMNYILGGSGFQSRLTKRIRVDEGLAYSAGSRFSMPVPVVGTFRAFASTRLEQAGRTLELLRQVITNYRDEGPTQEEFEKAKQAYINSFVWKYESPDDLLSRLVYYKWRGLPLNTPQLDLKAYNELTLDDVRKAARELLTPDSLVIVVVGDRDKMDRPLEDFGTVHELDLSQF